MNVADLTFEDFTGFLEREDPKERECKESNSAANGLLETDVKTTMEQEVLTEDSASPEPSPPPPPPPSSMEESKKTSRKKPRKEQSHQTTTTLDRNVRESDVQSKKTIEKQTIKFDSSELMQELKNVLNCRKSVMI